jgi:hypothetical protein
VLTAEGIALVAAKGCPLGIFQRRAGDDVPMFELWFGPRLAPFAVPALTLAAVAGLVMVATRRPVDVDSLTIRVGRLRTKVPAVPWPTALIAWRAGAAGWRAESGAP